MLASSRCTADNGLGGREMLREDNSSLYSFPILSPNEICGCLKNIVTEHQLLTALGKTQTAAAIMPSEF